jgi:hypothetical protein
MSAREQIVAASRRKYGTPRTEIEKALANVAIDTKPTPAAKPPAPDIQKMVEPPPSPPAAASPIPEAKRPEKPVLPADPGKGGAQHKAIQARIKKAGESLGFRVAVEQEIVGGSIDLVITRGTFVVACEITITTTIDHEVGNIEKCAKAGFLQIAVIAATSKKLTDLESAVSASLGKEIAQLVRYFEPDAFLEYLKSIPPPETPTPGVKVVKGYKVKTNVAKLSQEEAQLREQAGLKLIAEAMAKAKAARKKQE